MLFHACNLLISHCSLRVLLCSIVLWYIANATSFPLFLHSLFSPLKKPLLLLLHAATLFLFSFWYIFCVHTQPWPRFLSDTDSSVAVWMLKPSVICKMKEMRTELELDELEKLLGEIPNATYGKPHCDESGPKMVSLEGSLSSIRVNSCTRPISEKLQNYGSLDEEKISVNKIKQSPIISGREEMNLPDDQSLTSAFAGLGFTDGMTVGAGGPLPESKSLENCSMFLGGHYLNVLEKPNSNLDPQMRVVPENFSANAPFANAVQGFQFLSNVPVPAMPDQEQFFPGAQSVLPYSHSHQLNPPPTSWSNVEEEQYYRMHQQYLYLQQFPIQRFEAQHPIQAQGNVTTRLMSENLRQPYFEVPISNQLVKSRQESFWTNYRGSNQPHPALSFTESDAMPGLVKVAKHKFPERILTRSQGMNTLKTVKFGSVDGKESVDHVTQNGEVPSHCQLWDTISTPRTVDFQLDSLNSWGFSPKTTDIKSIYLKPLPQKYNSVNEVAGRVYLMAKDQHGCRFLQRKLAEGAPTDVEKIFVEIVDYIVDLMTDPFGNYLVQKLLEICDEDQQMQILHAITRQSGELVRISCNMHGTRAVQKVIETLKTPEQFSMIVSSLKPGIVTLMKNVNGNHVAQRCLQKLVPEYSEFLFEAATANCIDLATDRHGCCVLQKCLGHSDGEPRRRLVCKITSHALLLSQDPYGNYVVQFVLELRLPWAALNILGQLEGNYGDLSMQKFSSNVVEKCLRHAGEERQSHIIQELIDDPRLDQIMQDPYGNYVIQAALNQSKGAFHTALVAAIRQHDPVLQTSPYGKKVLSSCGLKK